MQMKLFVFAVFLAVAQAKSVEIRAESFESQVLNSNDVWVVEFYSDMCGSCKQFAPTWENLEGKIKAIHMGKVNIDQKDNMKLAQRLGVLEQGLPNVQLYNRIASDTGVTIVSGEEVSMKQILYQLKNAVTGLVKGDNGFYKKKRA